MKEKGLESYGHTPNERTVRNYMSLGTASPEFRVVEKTVDKTEGRFTTENSRISAVGHAVSVACASYIPCSASQAYDIDDDDDPYNTATMMTNALKCAVMPVHPSLLLSTDDTTVFAFVGKEETGHKWRITRKDESGAHRATYQVRDVKAYDGLRVRFTVTATAGGTMAAFYLTVGLE